MFNCRIRNIQTVFVRNLNYGTVKITDDYNPEKLIDINQHRILDSLFTLHYTDGSVFYVSEICMRNMNPNFNSVSVPKKKSWESMMIVKVWIKTGERRQEGQGGQGGERGQGGEEKWVVLVEWYVDLQKLVCVNEEEVERLGDNAIVIKIYDKLYTGGGEDHMEGGGDREGHKTHLPSYNFDTIRSINNLDKSLKEISSSKTTISHSINKLISYTDTKTYEWVINESNRLNDRLSVLTKYCNSQRNGNDSIMSNIMNIKTRINDIKDLRDEQVPELKTNFETEIELVQNQIPTYHESLDTIYTSIKQYFKDYGLIANEIIRIDKGTGPYDMTIMGNKFPSSTKEIMSLAYNGDFESLNNALAYIIQLIIVLIDLTGLEIYYAIEFKGNQSIIQDLNHQPFPLFFNPKLTKKVDNIVVNEPFEMGISLLNKNLLLLTHRLNVLYGTFEKETSLLNQIPIDCLDNFLWNLEYLLLFMTK